MLKFSIGVGTCLAAAGIAAPVHAAVTFYNNEAAFLSAVQPGVYTETFDGGPIGGQPGGLTYVGPGALPDIHVIGDDPAFPQTFPFLIPGGSPSDVWMGLTFSEVPIRFTVTEGASTAIAGTFANADVDGDLIAGTLTLEVIGQGSHTFVVTPGAGTFIGAVADAPISSFRLSLGVDVPGLDEYVAANNIKIATAIPEPAALSLIAIAVGGLLARPRGQ